MRVEATWGLRKQGMGRNAKNIGLLFSATLA